MTSRPAGDWEAIAEADGDYWEDADEWDEDEEPCGLYPEALDPGAICAACPHRIGCPNYYEEV